MTNKASDRFSASRLRHAVFAGLAVATLTGALAVPAYADDDHDKRDKRWNESRHEHPRYTGYYGQPNVYYSAPPVVYAPPAYYQPPVAALNFNFR